MTKRILIQCDTQSLSALNQIRLQVQSQREESELLLNLPPDRIGHGTFLHPEMGGSQSLVDKVVKNRIPLGKNVEINKN